MMKTNIPLMIVLLGGVVCNDPPGQNETPLRAQCPSGSYDASKKGSQPYCLPCPQGFYTDKYNNFPSCYSHRACKSSQEDLLKQGTNTSNVVCKCKKGGRSYDNFDDDYGYTCRECKNGTVLQAVARNALDDGDFVCCPNNTVALRNQHGDLQCQRKRQQDSNAPPAQNPPVPKDDLTESSDRRWVISGVVCVLIGLVLGAALTKLVSFCLKKRRRRSKLSSKASPPIYKAKYSPASMSMAREETVPTECSSMKECLQEHS